MPNGNINGDLASHGHITGVLTIGAGGTSDYEMLENKPQINGRELIDNQASHELGLASMQDVSYIASEVALLSQKLPKSYSTEEQNTGIKWIDGKTIYKKTVRFQNVIPKRNWNVYSFGVDNIEEIVNIEFNRIRTDNNVDWSLNYNNSGTYFNSYWLTSGLVLYWNYANANNVDVIITILYTKVE